MQALSDDTQGSGALKAKVKFGSVMPTGLEIDRSEASKAFFFEKKKQKTFASAVADSSGERATAGAKVFWSFFSKKDCLLSVISIKAGYGEVSFYAHPRNRSFWFLLKKNRLLARHRSELETVNITQAA